jgi:GrpB-like predicted nucleotidyltransferase (UPF0157 family)
MVTIELRPYDPAWAVAFDDEARRIRTALGNLELDHVGSTSVPGTARQADPRARREMIAG